MAERDNQQQPQNDQCGFPAEGDVDAKMYDDLSQYVASPRFLNAFEANRHPASDEATRKGGPGQVALHTSPPPGPEQTIVGQTDTACASQAGYVVVHQEDAVEAMAFYLAQCIAAHPEAQKLAPKQLQDALSNTLQGLKQTRFTQLCTYGRSAYRWSALTYSALQMYQNPWLIRAVITTIWAFSKLGMRAFV